MQAIAQKRILVVEDEFFIADDIACGLVDAGAIAVGPCSTCAEALKIISHDSIDAAILDIGLTGGDSVYPLAKQLNRQGVPFLFHTGYDAECMPPGFASTPRIEKPSPPKALLAAVEDLLRNRPTDTADRR